MHRLGDEISKLSKTPECYQFCSSQVKITFDRDTFGITSAETLLPVTGEMILSEASEMKILLDSISFTFLKTNHHAKKN